MKNLISPITTLIFVMALCTKIQAQQEHQLNYSVRQCNEEAIEIHLDPQPLQDFVGPMYPLLLDEGKARVVIVVHDCSQCWINGNYLGRSQDIRIWVLVNGPEDVRNVVGAQQTLPTRTWFSLLSGSSNPQERDANKTLGINYIPVKSIFVDTAGNQYRGQVFLKDKMTFKWNAISLTPPTHKLIGLNHDIYTRNSNGNIILNKIQALMNMYARYTPGTMDLTDNIDELAFIKPGTYKVLISTFFPMWSRATLGLYIKSDVLKNK